MNPRKISDCLKIMQKNSDGVEGADGLFIHSNNMAVFGGQRKGHIQMREGPTSRYGYPSASLACASTFSAFSHPSIVHEAVSPRPGVCALPPLCPVVPVPPRGSDGHWRLRDWCSRRREIELRRDPPCPLVQGQCQSSCGRWHW